jgi:hypothetical protein
MRSRVAAVAVAVTAALALGSCASDYDEATRDGLRQHVVAVAEASAAGDWNAALSGLDVMSAQLSDARAAGKIDEERFDSILLAMELVRQDLDTAIAAAADAAERQRLIDEQARLQEQIAQLEEQQTEDRKGGDEKKGEGEKKGEEGKGGGEGKGK